MKWTAFLFVPLALAGCLDDDQQVAPEPSEPVGADRFEQIAAGVPEFSADMEAVVNWWEAFVSPGKRDAYLPDTPVSFNQASREVIAQTLRQAGFDVTILSHTAGPLGAPDPVGVFQVYTVEAVWAGTGQPLGNQTEFGDIGLIAHYDTQAGTIEGAYDNGSGTAAVVHTCIELSKASLRRDLTCLLFDAEEIGAVASGQYVQFTDRSFDLVLGFDMVGINCPGPISKQYQWVGANFADQLHGFVQRVGHEVAGYSDDCLEVFDFNDRNSDESRFASAGIPTVRFAGIRTAGGYPEYHTPNDTPEFVYEYVGGRANWEAGLGATMHSAFVLASMFDATTLSEAATL